MKTIWEVLVVITFIGLFMGGLVLLGDSVFERQVLSSDSINLLNLTSSQVQAYNNNYTASLNQTDPFKETDLNEVEGFVQEYRDYKGKLDQLQDGLKLIYKAPDLLLYLVPFVDREDLGDYVVAYRFLVLFLLMFIVIIGLKNGRLFPDF